MLRLPKKWVLVAGLLAATPCVTMAGPLRFLKPGSRTTVSGQSARTNQQVATDIAAALKKAKLAGYDIDISFKEGVATLSGKIADPEQKSTATKIVASIDGVNAVENQLEVVANGPRPLPLDAGANPSARQADPRLSQGPPTAGPALPGMPQNQQVAQHIADALVAHGLGDFDLEIRYKNGVCSLIGDVHTPHQAAAAYQLASSVPGVQQVVTRMRAGGQPFDPAAAVQQVQYLAPPQHPGAGPQLPIQQMGAQYPGQQMGAQYPAQQMSAQVGPPPSYGPPQGGGSHMGYNNPNLPAHAWPSYAQYDNYAAVSYPSEYDASAWPYIGPFYPYPQVPLGWRDARLTWDDGYWNLRFSPRTDRWWWFLNPQNWH